MKAIILKNKGRKALALTQDGCYIRVKNKYGRSPGEEFECGTAAGSFPRILIPALSIALSLAMVIGVYAYYTPVAFVTADINPSVELTLNRFVFVIGSRALNEDGETILSDEDVLNRPLKTALNNLVDNAQGEGYSINESEGQILLTVFSTSSNLNDKVTKKLQETKDDLEDSNRGKGILIAASNLDRRDAAKELGISPGKLLLIEKIELEEGVELDPRNYVDISVKDIVAMGKTQHENNKNKDKDNNGNAISNDNKNKDDKDQDETSEMETEQEQTSKNKGEEISATAGHKGN